MSDEIVVHKPGCLKNSWREKVINQQRFRVLKTTWGRLDLICFGNNFRYLY